MTPTTLLIIALCSCTIPSVTLGFMANTSSRTNLPIHAKSKLVACPRRPSLLSVSAATSSENGSTINNNEDSSLSSSSSAAAASSTLMPFAHDGNIIDINRRSAIKQGAGTALSSLLLLSSTSSSANAAYGDDFNNDKKKRILITGSNSGIGLDAAQRMALRGHEIVLACRTLDKAKAAADKIKTNIANDSDDAVIATRLLKSLKLTPMECDLANLNSIDQFIANLKQQQQPFDAVCYNAGIARNTEAKDVARTQQGFELTVGTNHLGHFYLHHKLMVSSLINQNDGRIVVTASSVHDPDSPGGAQGEKATLGDLAGLEKAVSSGSKQFDMVDGNEFNADKAYKDSKLCNVLFTRELQRRLDAVEGCNIKVNAFTPGLIVGTGLFRDQNPLFTKLFDVAATNLLKVGESTHYGGGALEYMTLSNNVYGDDRRGGLYYYSPPGSSKYGDDAFGKQFDVSEVSKEALESDENGKAKRLWELSEKLVGVSS